MARGRRIASGMRREWLESYERGDRLDKIARDAGRTERTIKEHIEFARQEREVELARREQLGEALRSHQRDMLDLLRHLQEAVYMPTLDLLPWHTPDFGLEPLMRSRELMRDRTVGIGPKVSIASASQRANPVLSALAEGESAHAITVTCDRGGPKDVLLTVEGSRLWRALKEHLGNKDPLWRQLADWRHGLLEEFRSRASLNRVIREKAKETFHLPVVMAASPQKPHLTAALVRFVRVEVTRRALGEPPMDFANRVEKRDGRLEDLDGGSILGQGLENTDKGVEQLVSTVDAMTGSTEAQDAARTHRNLQDRTSEVQEALEEYWLVHYIRGRCGLCRKLGA